VLYVAWAPFFSGAERALVALLEQLDPSRYRPVVAVGTHGELEAQLRQRGIATTFVPIAYRSARAIPAWLTSVGTLARRVWSTRAAFLHANDVPSFQPAGYAARLLRLPAVAHVRFPDTGRGFDWFLRPGFDRAVFVSRALRDDAVHHARDLFAGRSEVIYDGVQVPALPDASARERIRKELALDRDATVAALVGQVAEIKGVWDFIDAAALLAARDVPVTFVVLGDDLKGRGALREQAQRVVVERGLGQRVRFLGFHPDAQRLIPAFDIVAAPSHVEPLGLTVLEGMAAGVAVVGSRVGGIQETIVDGETGFLVPMRDPEKLAGAIERFALDPELRMAFGRAGRRRVEQEFSVVTHARRIQAMYDRLRCDPAGRTGGYNAPV
jgi:glycosyltransferase involved in cell wall biosynthesis